MLGYGAGMSETAEIQATNDDVGYVVRTELARGDDALGTVAPILRHLIVSDDRSLLGEEAIARVRGMLADVARQVLAPSPGEVPEQERIAALISGFCEIPGLLGHIHALALEGQLAERLQGRLALDPVLPPLLQALIASPEPATAACAMNLLAAQARFVQNQRRMQLPLVELPGDLLHGALLVMRTHTAADAEAEARANAVETEVRSAYDESRSRLGLIARLVTGMGAGAVAALSVTHAGVAIFATALALASGQDRDLAVLSTSETQIARLALALRAAGLKVPAIEEQFLALHPDVTLPDGFDRLGPDRAAAILAGSSIRAGS